MTLEEFNEFMRRTEAFKERLLDLTQPIGTLRYRGFGQDGQELGETACRLYQRGFRVDKMESYTDGADLEMFVVEMSKPF